LGHERIEPRHLDGSDLMIKSLIASTGALLLTAGVASASVAEAALIDTIVVWTGGQVMVNTSGTRTSVPSCGSGRPRQYAFNSTTAAGKTQLSVLLTA
jgi:hypothetical protein